MASRSSSPKRGLGRGLGALIVNTDPANPASDDVVAQAEAGGIRFLSVDQIDPNPHQPRTQFDEEQLAELAASIREHGIIQPLIVTENLEKPAHYWLVAGERRWRAARRAGLDAVPAIIREATPQQLMEWALVENVQRADLNPLEEAAAYQTLIDEFQFTQAQVAERVGKSRSAVANTVRLLQLPPNAQKAVTEELISAGHARALLALATPQAIDLALAKIVADDLNVRQTETLVKAMAHGAEQKRTQEIAPQPSPSTDAYSAQLQHLENRLRSSLGTKVQLNRKPDGTGRLVIHFYNDDDLQGLFQLIAGEMDS